MAILDIDTLWIYTVTNYIYYLAVGRRSAFEIYSYNVRHSYMYNVRLSACLTFDIIFVLYFKFYWLEQYTVFNLHVLANLKKFPFELAQPFLIKN